MKQQVLSNLEIMRILFEETKGSLAELAEHSSDVQAQTMFLEEILTELMWTVMNAKESNY